MMIFLVYILKTAVCLAVFYSFYHLSLSKETFHRFKRISLLGILCLSYFIPSLDVTVGCSTEMNRVSMSLEEWLLMSSWYQETFVEGVSFAATSFRVKGVLALYGMGVLSFWLLQLYSLGKMCFLFRRCRKERLDNGICLYLHQEKAAPFSWMRSVVMEENDFLKDGDVILAHECAHVKNCHSWDLLLVNSLISLQWFNPAAWLLKKELQDIHEYEADAFVVSRGVDVKKYQLLLIEKAVGTRLYSMANSLNHSSLKKRITMMIKKKSNPWARLKFLYVLPLAAVAMVAFARPEASREISEVKVSELTSNPKAKAGKSVEKLETIGGNMPSEAGNQMSLLWKSPVVLVDGIRRNMSDIQMMDPRTIESMHVWKGKEAIERYGEQGRGGVIEIFSKKGGE